MKKISIIVPVYNIEKYIEKCIDSILNQSYKNYELIIIDDGSTDNSGQIIDTYRNNQFVKIIHKKNGGLSDARNYGINQATGEYLMFIDGDDYLFNNYCLQKLADSISTTKADIIQYKMVYFYERNQKYVYQSNLKKLSGNLIDRLTQLNCNGKISVSACDKIIRTSIVKNNILFEKGLLSEDIKWSYELYLNVTTIETLNENIYVYRQQRLNSITTSKSKKNAHDLYTIINYWYYYNYKNNEQKELYHNMISYWYLILRVNFKRKYYTNEMKESFKLLDNFFIKKHSNYKVDIAYRLHKVIGYNATLIVMKIYIFLKDKGLIRL